MRLLPSPSLISFEFCSRFYHSLAEQQIRATTEHGVYCDNCGGNIGGARISCLICQMKDTFNTVDFCSTPGCIDNRVSREDMVKAHLPHHDLIKVRRVLHTRFFGKCYRDAKEALKQARTFFKSPASATAVAEQDSESEVDTEDEEGHAPFSAKSLSIKRLSKIPTLAISIPQGGQSRGPGSGYPMSAVSVARSQVPVTTGPCAEASFICWDCDAKGEVSFGNHDFHTHDLVRVQELVEEKDLSVEERLAELEERFSKHEKTMDDRLGQIAATVDGRMAKVEALLEQLLKKIGPV
ncbi:VPS13 domain-containing protein [Mycena venus]|uniref:VPS13 domain-containing protein n=1 Tax=Mycena venus TaxID=2733690 RepID=A0A8H6WNY1_9AGAR|nr:VPS13 domain-containing protein [Mycena venus]